MNEQNMDKWMDYIFELGKTYIPKLALAIVTLIVGLVVDSKTNKICQKDNGEKENLMFL